MPDRQQAGQETFPDLLSTRSGPFSHGMETGPAGCENFGSLLFENVPDMAGAEGKVDLDMLSDLNLDQVVESIVRECEEQDYLRALLYGHLHHIDTVYYRQEVFRDLEDHALFDQISRFAEMMRQVRTHLTQVEKMRYSYQKKGWFLDAAAIYCDAVRSLASGLDSGNIKSRGLRTFRQFLAVYVDSSDFNSLDTDTKACKEALGKVQYCIRIRGSRVDVTRHKGEADYSAEVLKTFERFQQGAVKDYRIQYRTWPGMNHVSAQILQLVARLFSEEFSKLDRYCGEHARFLNETIRLFEGELQFYLTYLKYIGPLRQSGLSFCYPEITSDSKEVFAADTFDLALAKKLITRGVPIIRNEFHLEGAERIIVVSGPNQGGKTTFARTFGQLHHLASVGCPVPGSTARLFLFDRLFTHFEREEDLTNMSGKLEDDLVRIRGSLQTATGNSIIIMNEIFTSTTLSDSRFLGKKVMAKVIELGLLCVYVTFVDELASLDESVVSMVSTIVPENPAQRTYKVVRGPANGLAYALAIAEKYDLTYERLCERIIS